ncbi:MAG: helix-turn-helix transcriptional regulator, partial [Alphaproteobacteria bacterium]|nr:helix-turn-helix transcriptional regulator [Alphaproteobacteria bacterium]
MITGPQIRAARALIGWTAQDLADRALLSYPTVQRAETSPDVPSMKAPNLLAIQRALEGAGVVFLAEGE